MSPPSFPITPSGLDGSWEFSAVEPGTHAIGSFSVTAAEVRHKGGRTFGYRIREGDHDIAYLPDHIARGPITPALEELVQGVDLLVHDAQFLEAEREFADAYGHSTVQDAIDLSVSLRVQRLLLFHHSPTRTDEQLDAIAAGIDSPVPVEIAREGHVLEVPLH
jgi:ribonuclease BN (tRNA processing enzyme)